VPKRKPQFAKKTNRAYSRKAVSEVFIMILFTKIKAIVEALRKIAQIKIGIVARIFLNYTISKNSCICRGDSLARPYIIPN
jgi:hypothetical protein